MASVFLYHVIGDLTVGKPELVEFTEAQTVEAAIKAIGESTECGIPVWKKRSQKSLIENAEMRQLRFVGILTSLDIVAFLATEECLADQEKAMKTPVSQVVVPNKSLLKELDPATRLIDALEMMQQGVRRLLVPKTVLWRGMSKRFSVFSHEKWLRNIDTSNPVANNANNRPPTSSTTAIRNKFCCLSREDIIRFVIGCLGALTPIPLTSISSLGAINPNYASVEASQPSTDSIHVIPHDPSAVAVVEQVENGCNKIIGEISSTKLWKCDYLAAAWALANLSAGQFVMGVEDNVTSGLLTDTAMKHMVADTNAAANGRGPTKPGKFSSRTIRFISNPTNPSLIFSRSMYRGRSAPLTCKETSSLAAVMAQMLSHRAAHVWVTDPENEDHLIGVVGYADILAAITKQS